MLNFRWELEIKTVSTDGVVFYTTGGGENSDFVGVELIGGKVHVILDKGGGPAEVISEEKISDGVWHHIIIIFNPNMAQLIVDNKSTKQKLTLSTNKYFDLGFVVSYEVIYSITVILNLYLNKRQHLSGCVVRNVFH